jgi:hypothetical protein
MWGIDSLFKSLMEIPARAVRQVAVSCLGPSSLLWGTANAECREHPADLKEKLVLIGLCYNIFKRSAYIAVSGWCSEMNANLSMERALDELERRLDSLEEKVSIAMEQSTALLDYVRNHNIQTQTARTITRRIILEETTMLPEAVNEET